MKQRLVCLFRDPRVGGLLLLALAVRLILLPARTLWSDEAYSVRLSSFPLEDIWRLTAEDVHPPLYYFCLRLTMQLFGDSLWAIRGLSVLAGCLAVGLAICWLRLFASRRALYISLLLLALQPVAVRWSQEARMYALLAMWMMAASLLLAMWLRRPAQWRYPLLYTLVATASLYTHYFALFGLASHWLYIVLTEKGRRTLLLNRRWWLANVAAALLFSPWLPELWQQLHTEHDLGWILPLTLTSVPTTLWEFFWALDQPLRDWPGLGVLVPALLGWALWQVLMRRHREDRYAVILLATVPFVIACLVSLVIPLFFTRYLSFTALPMVMLIGLAVDSLWRRHPRAAGWVLAAVCAVQVVGLFNGYRSGESLNGPTGERSGIGPLAAHLYQNWRPGDEAVAYGETGYNSVLYYLRHYPLPWQWMNQDDVAPVTKEGMGLQYNLGRHPWLWQYEQTPPGTCGIWLFSRIGANPPTPSAQAWTPTLYWAAYDDQLQYYARRSCAAGAAQ